MMKYKMDIIKSNLALVLLVFLVIGCEQPQRPIMIENEENWSERKATIEQKEDLEHGMSYLSVYSQMYSYSQNQKYNLTGLVSLRNVSEADTIYLLRADYFNTEGAKIRTYFDFPIFVLPMETLEIVIAQKDVEGGTGSNFLIEWKIPLGCPEPLFEGVMNSMLGNQGVSFTTHARRTK